MNYIQNNNTPSLNYTHNLNMNQNLFKENTNITQNLNNYNINENLFKENTNITDNLNMNENLFKENTNTTENKHNSDINELIYVKNVYEEIAEHFNNTRIYKWKWVIQFLEKLPPYSIIYDLGCGNGKNMNYNNLNFIGIDNCENFIKICNNKKLNIINSNIYNLPFKNYSADAILCIAVFHHLSTLKNRIKTLKEIKRVSKPNALILLSVWSFCQPTKTRRKFNNYGNNIILWNNFGKIYERYYYIFKLDELKDLFKQVGLTILNYEYNFGNEIFTLINTEN